MGRKDDHPSDILGDTVLIVLLAEEPGQPLRGHIVHDALREHTLAGLLNGFCIHICCKDLYIPVDVGLFHHLFKKDGQGIGFLPCGTPGAPHTDGLLFLGTLYDGVDGVFF